MTYGFYFFLKRAHHGGLRLLRGLLQRSGLTPARFDLLEVFRGRRSVRQSELHAALGVSRTVVSRMLQSMEERGIVDRSPSRMDRRTLDVTMTEHGRLLFRIARILIVKSGEAVRVMTIALTGGCRDEFEAYQSFEGFLDGLRRECGDTATLLFPWHPDD